MKEKRTYKDYLVDIIESIGKIEKFTQDLSFENFKSDEKTILAIIRALEVIGEAAKKIPAEVKKKYSQIPWKKMAGMRDKLIHEYFGVNIKVVWRTIKEDIPELKPKIEKLLSEIE
jgi:uncharacterized protein with HEPN domain